MRVITGQSSPNFEDRKDGLTPELIIVHYTGMESTEAVLEKFADPASKVGAHYLIDEKGNIYALIDESKRAYHAGEGTWMGKGDVNSRSIGIEISNRNGDPYTKQQLFSLAMLIKDIQSRYDIPPENILGHSDIAPHRKQDPGEHFPWQKLSRHDIGRWPKPTIKDKFNAAAVAKDENKLKALFHVAGYDAGSFAGKPTLEEIITAFQRRYEPEVFKENSKTAPGTATATTVAKLRAVARMNNYASRQQAKPATP